MTTKILQIESLEILDLSRNRIKVLPEEIGNLTSLKVLAISRNKIERLPIRLCELSRLQLLKFDDNPLVFPPPESYSMDSLQPKTMAPGEYEAIVTGKIKRSLYKASKRGASSKDLDAE
jgi:Leucine-rich repeat (LRR) protein